MKIAILEKTNFNDEQKNRLSALGQVDYYENLSQEEANNIAVKYDVVVVNWLDPTPFILNMKQGSLVSLLSTGYGWISNINEAHERGISVSNIPGYSTEAVAEHLLGLLLGVTKNIFPSLCKTTYNAVGCELHGKTIGIIGLGNIGTRFAQIMDFFGAHCINYSRTKKNNPLAADVSLDELLSQSDIVCITCSVNSSSRNLINSENISRLRDNVIIIGSTWDIIEEKALACALQQGRIGAVSFDAAVEGSESTTVHDLTHFENVFFTPHIAYNTNEAEKRQLDICVSNIEQFISGRPQNIVF